MSQLEIIKAKEGSVISGIRINERNRATSFEYFPSEIAILRKIAVENYLNKGVNAVLVSLPVTNIARSNIRAKVAVYVEEGFLVPVERGGSDRGWENEN